MTPIFDADNALVGFFDGTYLFDVNNDWVAFHDRDNVFATSGTWLGALRAGSFLDLAGRPVGWLAGSSPTSGLKPPPPMNPKMPLHPKRPLRPRTPLPPPRPMQPAGGWSTLSWAQWIRPAVARIDVDSLRIDLGGTNDARERAADAQEVGVSTSAVSVRLATEEVISKVSTKQNQIDT